MRVGDKVVCIKSTFGTQLQPGDTGVISRMEDYVPGWDAGQFNVKLDKPRTRFQQSCHWKYQEMAEYWRLQCE